MNTVMVDPGLEIKGFVRKPDVPCPPSGLVINPNTGTVAAWSIAATAYGDILKPYDRATYPQADVSAHMLTHGANIATRNGHAPPVQAAPRAVVEVADHQPVAPETLHAYAPFTAPNFS